MAEQTHYDILGITETTTPDELKKQYRSLARQYHPDVNPNNQEAAKRFAAIAEAYRVLSNPETRRLYDAERALRLRETMPNKPVAPGPAPAASNTATPPKPGTIPQPSAALAEAERLVQQAQIAFTRNRMAEARSLAEQALRFHRKYAAAYDVLGDICRVQNRIDDAMHHYTMSLQLDPRNNTTRQKMERIAKMSAPPRPAAGGYTPSTPIRHQAPRPTPAAGAPSSPFAGVSEEKRSLAVVLVALLGYGFTFVTILFAALFLEKSRSQTEVLPLSWVSSWSWGLISCMAIAGGLLGATMAITGAIRRIEDDLILNSSSGQRTAPLGLFIVLLGAGSFPVAAVVHLAISLFQESFTLSLARVYVSVAIVTLLMALTWTGVEGGVTQTLLFGGNIIFVCYVVGWLLGDFFRQE